VGAADPWWREGLRFECTRCGNCCGGAPGIVRVSDAEIAALARRVELPEAEFRETFTRPLRGGERSLRERRDGTCVFYDASRGCSVYSDRPRQCRTWPFWRAVVHSPERWAEEAQACPGMGRGPLHDAASIARALEDDGTSGAISG
jgi:Fe-S-cluster containining protein